MSRRLRDSSIEAEVAEEFEQLPPDDFEDRVPEPQTAAPEPTSFRISGKPEKENSMPRSGWTEERRRKFMATMAAKFGHKRPVTAKNSEPPRRGGPSKQARNSPPPLSGLDKLDALLAKARADLAAAQARVDALELVQRELNE